MSRLQGCHSQSYQETTTMTDERIALLELLEKIPDATFFGQSPRLFFEVSKVA